MTQKKLLLSLCFAVFLINAMEKPGISNFQRNFLKSFIDAERNNDFGFFNKKSDNALITVAPLVYTVLEDERELEALRRQLKITKEELVRSLNNVIVNVQRALELSPANQPQEKAAAPAPIPVPKPREIDPRKTGHGRLQFLYNFVDAEINHDRDYISSRPISTYDLVIGGIKSVLESNEKFAEMQSVFNISKKQLQAILEQVLQDARNFKQAKENEPLLKPSSAEPKQSSIPASKPIILDPRKSDDKMRVLYRFINAELKGDNDYITTRNSPAYKMVIEGVRIALESKEQLETIQRFF